MSREAYDEPVWQGVFKLEQLYQVVAGFQYALPESFPLHVPEQVLTKHWCRCGLEWSGVGPQYVQFPGVGDWCCSRF